MNRQEFLSQLAKLLEDLPEAERREALDYYNNYFDDAGPENEAFVIRELGGDPQKAAASLKAEFQSAKTGRQSYGEYTEQGYRDNRIPYDGQMPQPVPGQEKQAQNQNQNYKSNKTLKILIAVAILVVTSTIWMGLLGGLVGLIFGILGAVLSMFAGLAALVIGMIASGVALTVSGIIKTISNPALGLLAAGIGLMSMAVGFLLLVLFVWLASRLLPRFIRWCGRCISGFFRWGKKKWKNFIN